MSSPGFEPRTFSVLDWRDNQLHHEDRLQGVTPIRSVDILSGLRVDSYEARCSDDKILDLYFRDRFQIKSRPLGARSAPALSNQDIVQYCIIKPWVDE